jgi:hypothetical protein
MSNTGEVNPAATYNNVRRIILCEFVKNPNQARLWLERYRERLGTKGYLGLRTELNFFEKNHEEFRLTPALDVGDSCDFVGEIDGRMSRIDVTANISFKNLSKYEPFQAKGHRY